MVDELGGDKRGASPGYPSVTDYVGAALRGGHLIRKSFEYRNTDIDTIDIDTRASVLRVRRTSCGNQLVGGLNRYWAREHAFAQIFSARYGMNYHEYLPGRVYTYRVLCNRIVESVEVRSIIDVGCGSGMILHETARKGLTASGIDVSANALIFARYLAEEFGSRNVTLINADALGSWRPPIEPADLVSNLGTCEHLPFDNQLRFARYMGQLSRKYVLISVPNTRSGLFTTMESRELGIQEKTWIYPEEFAHFDVDWAQLARALGWSIVIDSCVHIPSTSLTGRSAELHPRLELNLRGIPRNGISSEVLMDAWLKVEASCSARELDSFGWFRYAIFDIT